MRRCFVQQFTLHTTVYCGDHWDIIGACVSTLSESFLKSATNTRLKDFQKQNKSNVQPQVLPYILAIFIFRGIFPMEVPFWPEGGAFPLEMRLYAIQTVFMVRFQLNFVLTFIALYSTCLPIYHVDVSSPQNPLILFCLLKTYKTRSLTRLKHKQTVFQLSFLNKSGHHSLRTSYSPQITQAYRRVHALHLTPGRNWDVMGTSRQHFGLWRGPLPMDVGRGTLCFRVICVFNRTTHFETR